jgi:dihydrofolate reductase
MRKVVVHMQTTLNGRISNEEGGFWTPFPFGDPEWVLVNEAFRKADSWAMGRRFYEYVVPYWVSLAAGTAPDIGVPDSPQRDEFARIQLGLTKIVFSTTMDAGPGKNRQVIAGDIAGQLARLKKQPGKDIILSSGPDTLAELTTRWGLIDEYLLVIHPAVITAGPRLFDGLDHDLGLELVHAQAFDAGAIIARYRVLNAR